MFSKISSWGLPGKLSSYIGVKGATKWFASCDEGADGENSLMAQADAMNTVQEDRFTTPQPFDMLRHYVSPVSGHNNFDGFRLTATKLLNMNCQVMHQYLLGSSQTNGMPFYQYRLFYGIEDFNVQIGSDLDMNSDGYMRKQLSPNDVLVSKWAFRDGSDHLECVYERTDDCSAVALNYQPYGSVLSASFTQSITPKLVVGGLYNCNMEKKMATSAFGGSYSYKHHVITGLLDEDGSVGLGYLCSVNPGRVEVTSEYKLSPQEGQTCSVGAEYTLKQAKLQFSVDSNGTLRSATESNVGPGVKLQLSAEIQHATDQFKCGYGLQFES